MVDQFYRNARNVSLPFGSWARRFLEYTGPKVVSTEYDLKLEIRATGKAHRESYSRGAFDPPYILYTSDSLQGSISLSTQGLPAYRKTFGGATRAPKSISEGGAIGLYKTPSQAPFRQAFKESRFMSKISEMMGEAFGVNCLIAALTTYSIFRH